jgi:hypothetical protein
MPIKKQPKVFMNHIVIHPDQKPVAPWREARGYNHLSPTYGIKFN